MLCVLAMFGAQVFGSAARFICDCGGEVKVVATSSCSGPHGQECHSDGAHEVDGSHGGSTGGDEKHHEQKTQELATAAFNSHIVVPSPMVLAILAEYFFFAPESSIAPREYLSDAYGGPPPTIALSRTVVLRI